MPVEVNGSLLMSGAFSRSHRLPILAASGCVVNEKQR